MTTFNNFEMGGELKLPGELITPAQWKEFQEGYDQIKKDWVTTKNLLQGIKDILEGRIRSANIIEYRNTYVYTDYGILDADNPLIIDFELIDEMTKLVSCKFSFKVRPFREGVK